MNCLCTCANCPCVYSNGATYNRISCNVDAAQGTVLCVVLLFHDPAYDHQADSGQPFDRAMPTNDYKFILFRCQTKTAPLFLNITQGTVLCVSLD